MTDRHPLLIGHATGGRICPWCYDDIPADARSTRVFCRYACRQRAKAKRQRQAPKRRTP